MYSPIEHATEFASRCVLHRATPYDAVKYKRLMQRTTIGGDPLDAVLD